MYISTILVQIISKINLNKIWRSNLVDLLNFGKTLKELRIQHGLTQQQLALQLGITKSVVSYYELQERSPSPDILVKLASIFHVSTDYLLGLEKCSTPDKIYLDVSDLESEDITTLNLLITHLRNKNMQKNSRH
ncbi:MAG: XRE family transcriptional regulator [Lachnospiraceae bacterium]|nr:XRE family transcriptional regulator [Lachnospiraceae bacterium]